MSLVPESSHGGGAVAPPVTLTSPDAATLPLSLVGAVGQTAPYLELRDSNGGIVARFDSFGTLDLARTVNCAVDVDVPVEQVVFGIQSGFDGNRVRCVLVTDGTDCFIVKTVAGAPFFKILGNGVGETVEITPSTDGDAALSLVKHSATQTGNMLEVWDETFSTIRFRITPNGGVVFPSADPHVAGAWWDNAGTLTRSTG